MLFEVSLLFTECCNGTYIKRKVLKKDEWFEICKKV